ncbi:hypothetical protein [Burkholderia glumae]|uniref:hypothetical protein n=1 Tax=Burkholderia glumae TaxID=337 RepID=UPI00215150B9|nr:hypothetical protein [Burkholderia glumae]
MNSITGVVSVAVLALVSGCAWQPKKEAPAAAPKPEVRVIDTSCQWVKVLRPGCSDVIGDDFARQIIEHNKAGVEHGCWKAPTKSACPTTTN